MAGSIELAKQVQNYCDKDTKNGAQPNFLGAIILLPNIARQKRRNAKNSYAACAALIQKMVPEVLTNGRSILASP